MTILNDGLGGVDAVDGTALPATSWNQTMDALKVFSTAMVDAATYTNAAASYVTASTFTLSNLSSHFLIGFRLQAQLQTTAGGEAKVRIRIVGTNTGDYRITGGVFENLAGVKAYFPYFNTVDGDVDYFGASVNTSYDRISANGFLGLDLADDTVIVVTEIKDDGVHTTSIKDTHLFLLGVGRRDEIES